MVLASQRVCRVFVITSPERELLLIEVWVQHADMSVEKFGFVVVFIYYL